VAPTSAFAELEDDFFRISTETVFCAVTTVDEAGRPRSRMLHPIFVDPHGELIRRVWRS
jgi:hypothetical protein